MTWVWGTVEASLKKAISESSRLEGEVSSSWTRTGIRCPSRLGGRVFYFIESSWISRVWKVYPNFRDIKMLENMINDDWRMPLTARHISTPETLKSREVCNSEIRYWCNSHRALGLSGESGHLGSPSWGLLSPWDPPAKSWVRKLQLIQTLVTEKLSTTSIRRYYKKKKGVRREPNFVRKEKSPQSKGKLPPNIPT